MPVWKLDPVARNDDPHWDACQYRRPLLVYADTSIVARHKAASWYQKNFGRRTCRKCPAFENEKLYDVFILPREVMLFEESRYPLVQ